MSKAPREEQTTTKKNEDLSAGEKKVISAKGKTPRQPLFLVSPDAGKLDLDDDESIDRWAEQVLMQAFGVTEFAENDEP